MEKLWNNKLIEKLLIIVTVINHKRFIPKDKLVINTSAFIELYNWKNCGQVYEIYEIIEFKRYVF